ncbi:hypothetical protein BB560_000770 [Smittium megazygosporum]|uniref:ER membrane protein complex subunit 1 n=1 Tax=Smittium megazygosporum TaxID=133381 RepID=A0A2T9ZJC4_9FUNG|nr:hypothetical protein BB560_000770 [Smittium megazygosporum]
MRLSILIPSVWVFLLHFVVSVYQDQVGVLDWHKTLIGKSKLMLDDKLRNDIMFSVSENNVLAAINITNSKLVWRQVGQPGEKIFDLKQFNDKIFTVSGDSSQYFRMWDKDTGLLSWEYVNPKPSFKAGGAFLEYDETNLLAAVGTSVFRFEAASGKLLWSRDLSKYTADFGRVISFKDKVYALGNLEGSKKGIRVAVLKLADGSLVKEYNSGPGQSLDSDNFVILHSELLNPYILWRDQGNIVWFVHKLGITNPEFVTSHAKLFQLELMPPAMLTSIIVPIYIKGSNPMIALLYSNFGKGKAVIASLSENNFEPEFTKIIDFEHSLPNYGRSTMFVSQKGIVSSLSITKKNYFKFKAIDIPNWGKILYSGFAKFPSTFGPGRAQSIFTNLNATNFVVQSNDGQLYGYSPSEGQKIVEVSDSLSPVWSRDESLASTVDSVFVHYTPAKQTTEGNIIQRSSEFPWIANWILRIHDHSLSLYKFITSKFFVLFDNDPKKNTTPGSSSSNLFSTMVVFINKFGRVSAYDSNTGNQLWGVQLKHESDDSPRVIKRPWLKLQKIYSSQEHNSHSPTIVISGLDGEMKTVFTTIDALSGTIVPNLTKNLDTRVNKIIETDMVDQETLQKVYILLSLNKGNITAMCWPPNPVLSSASSDVYFNIGNKPGSQALQGYKATLSRSIPTDPDQTSSQSSSQTQSVSIDINKVWEFNLSSENLQLLTSSSLKPNMRVSSIGRILSNRKVLYRYLNPNMMSILASSKDSRQGLKLFIIDRVSGRILYSAEHKNAYVGDIEAKKPLVVMYENWAVYYFSSQNPSLPQTSTDDEATPSDTAVSHPGYTIISLELFESDVPDSISSKKTFSSYDVEKPYVLTQSYLIPNALSSLGVTRTFNSISMPNLILALRNSPLSLVPFSEVDPRRSNPSLDKSLESSYLKPYEPSIEISANEMISYSLSIKGVNTLKSTFTSLESTTLILATGLDVFCSQESPSGKFDELTPSFSKWNLSLTIFLLLVASIVVAPFAKKKVLSDLWN